ncbi:T9SS sorting signal type C domain-containing protein [Flavobacterium gawalongense]|uniref:T9SS type A sorting domain-containing protein n=1 Tax=Flavobacterium gawalongense TaxID=2594432 RepID=A0A553BDS5_9FLAO|nr:T9SS sorting signal type C domain-containing protein [Flavobacterium gawalongense]TRX06394.1 T9SS type A sorting domain-containing protein [Flavobacterium gawalongense]TRX12737.1 T9SS type A sorting domain-containing protein [Flavobacterium gawalongense]TRX30474.1 T9SS type A sorting domain-containing protein [Flavobacterium gawalongense]
MKTLLHKSGVFIIVLLLFAFSGIVNAQCPTITGNVNSSTLTSSSFASCGGIINIGNGSTPTTLYMNAELNLTSLGAIQLIVRSGATLDFSSGNNRLYLKEGSSIIIQSGGGLVGGSCNASERIYIGTNLLASCNGGAGADVSFADIVTLGGTGSATSNSPVCVGNPINLSAAPPPNGGPYTYSWSGPGITAPTYSNSPNYTLSATVSGIYQVKMKSTMLNTSVTPNVPFIMIAETTVTVNTGLSTAAPTASVTLQPTCSTPTGTITITAPTAVGMTYSINGLTYTNTTGVFTSVAIGTYSVTAKNSSGCISPGTSVTIAQPSTIWDGTLWSNGVPTSSTVAILNGSYTTNATNGNIDACSLTINSGTLTIGSQYFVTIQNNLTVNAGATLDVLHEGSLVMINDSGTVTNSGTINVHKTTTPFELYDYTYWSTPIVSTTIATTFPTWNFGNAFGFSPANFIDANNDGFDDNGDDWVYASTMTPGKGYIIMGPTTGSFSRTESVVFSGKVNNGVVTTGIALSPGTDPGDDFNLVGNPYPSAISADVFINANIISTGTINKTIEGTLYFWTHKGDISVSNPGPDTSNYSQDDYAVYTLAGGVGTLGSVSGGAKPSGYIASGQGFFVEADAAGSLTFNNAMRVNLPATANTQFYKTVSIKDKPKAKERDRVWLNLENADGMFSQQLVGYFDNTTLGYDKGYDGLVNDAGNYVSFYSFINEDAYRIQGRVAFNENDQVRLGYFSAVAGTFNINIDSKEGVFNQSDTGIYLEDKLLNAIHDLKQGPYSFTTEKGTFNDRFVLRYTNKAEIGKSFNIQENVVLVSNKNRQIEINSSVETINKVQMYDLSGRLIYQKRNVNTNELAIFNLVQNHQTLLIKIVLQNGQTVTKKIVN